MDNEKFSITQMESLSGISAFTLRYYDKCGFFPHIERDARKKRFYGEEDLHRLKLIEALRLSGLSIEGIGDFLRDYDAGEDVSQVVASRAEEIDAAKARLDGAKLYLLDEAARVAAIVGVFDEQADTVPECATVQTLVESESVIEPQTTTVVDNDDDDDDDDDFWPYSSTYVPRHSRL